VIPRREWLRAATIGVAAMASSARAGAQQRGPDSAPADTSNLFPMDQTAARTVRLPPKPGAGPSMTPLERDALEHRIRCQCGCTLDVFTCRTTDFSCQVSPQMHRDVLALVQGGHTAQEILDGFVDTYGEQVLMAPPKAGFNILAYVLPGIALAVGAIVLAVVIRGWRRPAAATAVPSRRTTTDATPDELARLDAAIRDDS
jgi:cytochrome c-type biogenesis protein CcmH